MKFTDEEKQAIISLESKQGKLTPQQVLEAARDEESPLHRFFEWDDSTAAEAYRVEQARDLIKKVKVIIQYEETEIKLPRYMRDIEMESDEQGYINVGKIRQKSVGDTLVNELGGAAALLKRAYAFSIAKTEQLPAGVSEEIETLIQMTNDIINKL
jgi:hypothetical protein